MAYADQEMSGNRIAAFVVVALLHLILGYALVTGLAYEGLKQIQKKLTTVEIKKEEKKEEKKPPPPPKKLPPPPIVAPPPKINVSVAPPPVETVVTPPPILPPPPAPPAPRFTPKAPQPKGNPGNWANSNDYPSRAAREEKEGTTRFRVTVGADGRVTSCEVTSSSGSDELDSTACALVTRRGRFNPATDGEGNPVPGTWSNAVRWQLPRD